MEPDVQRLQKDLDIIQSSLHRQQGVIAEERKNLSELKNSSKTRQTSNSEKNIEREALNRISSMLEHINELVRKKEEIKAELSNHFAQNSDKFLDYQNNNQPVSPGAYGQNPRPKINTLIQIFALNFFYGCKKFLIQNLQYILTWVLKHKF